LIFLLWGSTFTQLSQIWQNPSNHWESASEHQKWMPSIQIGSSEVRVHSVPSWITKGSAFRSLFSKTTKPGWLRLFLILSKSGPPKQNRAKSKIENEKKSFRGGPNFTSGAVSTVLAVLKPKKCNFFFQDQKILFSRNVDVEIRSYPTCL
jgi:hypothetical protein